MAAEIYKDIAAGFFTDHQGLYQLNDRYCIRYVISDLHRSSISSSGLDQSRVRRGPGPVGRIGSGYFSSCTGFTASCRLRPKKGHRLERWVCGGRRRQGQTAGGRTERRPSGYPVADPAVGIRRPE